MFFGVVDFSRNSTAISEHALQLTRRVRRHEHQVIEPLHDGSSLSLFNLFPENLGASDVLELRDSENRPCWFSDITGTHVTIKERITDLLERYQWDTPIDLPGQWIALQWDENSPSLKIATDFLGSVWLYLAQIPGGYVFAQDFGALAGHPAFRGELDDHNILVELGLGYLPDNSTIYKNISIVPPGAVVELSASGIRTVALDTLSYGSDHGSLKQAQKFQMLDGIFERIYTSSIENQTDETCISLSAGMDSRYALALLQKHGRKCQPFTFGAENSEEVFQARRIASLTGSAPEVFSFDQASWSGWSNTTRQLGNIGMIQWVGWSDEWLRLLSARHRYVLIGYLGDALSGKHLRLGRDNHDWMSAWVDWSIDAWASSPYLREDCQAEIRDLVRNRLAAVADMASLPLPHQLAMHLDLFGRQRRWVASQPNLISNYLRPKTYFVNRELVDFWINLPYEDLHEQRLYRSYAQSRFPQLFNRNEFKKSLTSRIRSKITHGIKDLVKGQKPSRVPFVIERDRILYQNIDDIRELVDKTEDKLNHIIDFQALSLLLEECHREGTLSQAKSGIMMRGVNLMMLVDNER